MKQITFRSAVDHAGEILGELAVKLSMNVVNIWKMFLSIPTGCSHTFCFREPCLTSSCSYTIMHFQIFKCKPALN